MGYHQYHDEEIHWLLLYKLLGLSSTEAWLLHNTRFPDLPRTIDAILTKLKEVKKTNNLQLEGTDKFDLRKVDQYLLERINVFDIILRQHYHLKRLPEEDRRVLERESS